MKTTTTVTGHHKSGEITDFQNKEIFINGSHLAIMILNTRQGTFSLLDVVAWTMVHFDLKKEEMVEVLIHHKYKSFKGKVVFKQD